MWAGFRKNIPDELKQLDHVELCQLDVTSDSQVQAAVIAILKKDGKLMH